MSWATAAAAGAVSLLGLGGCAAAPAAPSATPTATPAPTPTDPHGGWQDVATPNGTAAFRIPPGWTADTGGEAVQYDGETHWVNAITARNEAGTMSVSYYDGPYDDVGAAASFGVVRSTPVATLDAEELAAAGDTDPMYLEHHASAWWESGDGTTFSAYAGLATSPVGDSAPASTVIDGERTVSLGVRESSAARRRRSRGSRAATSRACSRSSGRSI